MYSLLNCIFGESLITFSILGALSLFLSKPEETSFSEVLYLFSEKKPSWKHFSEHYKFNLTFYDLVFFKVVNANDSERNKNHWFLGVLNHWEYIEFS